VLRPSSYPSRAQRHILQSVKFHARSSAAVICSAVACIGFASDLWAARHAALGTLQTAQESFHRELWTEDYAFLKSTLKQSYANLAWFASPQSGVDLPGLDRRTRRILDSAENEDDARSAILAFVAGFHDGHFEQVPTEEPSAGKSNPPPAAFDDMDPASGCAALGYAPVRSIAFSLPLDALRGSSIESDGLSRVFRAGIVQSASGTRFGVVRIPRFRPQDAPPSSCIEKWNAWRKTGQPIKVDVLKDQIQHDWFQILAAQLSRFRGEKVAAVIVDVGGNTGGNDSGDWAARLFTPRDVHSARLLLAAAPSANAYFDEELQGIREALEKHPEASAQTQHVLREAISHFEQRKSDIASRSCDLSWAWREQRPWNPAGCSGLIDAGFASGELDYLAAGSMEAEDLASAVYWPAAVDRLRGAWSGPVYILTDGKTASSAEMFSAVMQDNGVAKIVGTNTEGDGCGFMDDAAEVVLPHSRLRFRVPNCVRLRRDGTDEVAGIKPDLPVLPTEGEDARARAARMLELIDADLRKN